MTDFDETLGPLDGVGPNDTVNLSIRKEGGGTEALSWDNTEEAWLVSDSFGSKQISGTRAVEEKTGNFTVSSADKDKLFIVEPASDETIQIELGSGFPENSRFDLINSGEGIVRFTGNARSQGLIDNEIFSTGSTTLFFREGEWKATFTENLGITRSNGFVDEFDVDTGSGLEPVGSVITPSTGVYLDSENVLWVEVLSGDLGSGFKLVRYDFDSGTVTDEISQDDSGYNFTTEGYIFRERPLFEYNGFVWTVSIRGSDENYNIRMVKVATDGSSAETFAVPSSVKNQQAYDFAQFGHTYNAPREIGRFIMHTVGGSIISFDLNGETWRFERDVLSRTYKWNSAYIPSTDELWVNYYIESIDVYSRDNDGKFSNLDTTYDASANSKFGGTNVSSDIYYDSQNDRVAILRGKNQSGETYGGVTYLDTDGSFIKDIDFNEETEVESGYIIPHAASEKEGTNVLIINYLNTSAKTAGLLYYDYVTEEVLYTSFEDRISVSYTGSDPNIYDVTKLLPHFVGRESENKVYYTDVNQKNSTAEIQTIQSFELQELASTFERFAGDFVVGGRFFANSIVGRNEGPVPFPSGAKTNSVVVEDEEVFSVQVESGGGVGVEGREGGNELFVQPSNGPARFKKGVEFPYPFSISPERVSEAFDFEASRIDTDIVSDGETVGYRFNADLDTVARVVGDYDSANNTLVNSRFEAEGDLRGVDSSSNPFFEASLAVDSIKSAPDLTKNGSLGSGTVVEYRVVARDSNGSRTLLSPTSTVNIDPTSLDGSNFVTVDWQAASGNVSDYVVVKDEGQTGTFVQIGSPVAAGTTTFDDTGQSTSSFTVPSRNETAVTSLGVNNTADTSGDLQIRDDSSGDLYSLDDGASPQVAARYEGNGAFTLGYRDTSTVEQGSVSIQGFSDNNQVESDPSLVEAIGAVSIGVDNQLLDPVGKLPATFGTAIGYKNKVSGPLSLAIGGASNFGNPVNEIDDSRASMLLGHEQFINGDNSYGIGLSNNISGDNSYAIGLSDNISGDNSYAIGLSNNITGGETAAVGYSIDTDGGIRKAVFAGRYNAQVSGDFAFAVGVGRDDTNRANGLVVEGTDDPSDTLFTRTGTISFDPSKSKSAKSLNNATNSILSANSSGAGGPNNSIIWESTSGGSRGIGSANIIAFNSEFNSDESFYSAFDSAIFSSTIGSASEATIEQGSFLINTSVTSSTENDLSYLSSNNNIIALSWNEKQFIAYGNDVTSGTGRTGSVIIAGGDIQDVQDSVALGGATVSTNNTVGIGANTFINTSNTSAFDVQDGSGNSIFSVDTTNNVAKATGTVRAEGGTRSANPTISDDSVATVTPDRNQVKVFISDGSGEAGEATLDIANGVVINTSFSTTNFTFTTGNLGGTTGTDGNLTVSADSTNGTIDIENRLGGSRTVTVAIIG